MLKFPPWLSPFVLLVCAGAPGVLSLTTSVQAQAVPAAKASGASDSEFADAAALPAMVQFPDATTTTASLSLPDAPRIVDGSIVVVNPPAAPLAFSPLGPGDTDDYKAGQQTKRILFIIPNFRSVSVDAKLKPLSVKQKFGLATSDSFDYSSFIYVGLLAGVDFAEKSTPEFHQGMAGYGRYYWHDFADNTIGNYMTEAIVPSITHEDPRYYTLGRGGLFKRTYYAISRLVITRTDANPDKNTFNISEIVGNGAGAGISNFYYPSPERTWTKTGQKWLLEIGLDGGSNIIKEFWPDVAHALFGASKESVAPEGQKTGSAPAPTSPPAPQQ